MGGLSAEKEVSLKTGRCVAEALRRLGYSVVEVVLTQDISAFVNKIYAERPDVFFNALHGKYGEDGCVPGLLNLMGIPYTHSGVLASSIGMDKNHTRHVAKLMGVPIAKGELKTLDNMKTHPFPLPYVAKPNDNGSSIGVHIVKTLADQDQLFKSWKKTEKLLIEQYIPGRELSAAVCDNQYLGDIELVPTTGFYDYKNKYTAGKTQHLSPAPISPKVRARLKKYTLMVHKALGCRGVTRCDFRLDDQTTTRPKLVFLEINTHPGMTELSLVPDIAKQQKISYDDLINQLVMEAKCD